MITMKKIFVLGLSVILFAACSNDDLGDGPGGGGGGEVEGEAWVALSISTGSSGSHRSLNTNPNQDLGTVAESKITSVKAIFFDDIDAAVAKVTKVIDLNDAQIGTPGSTGSVGEAFKVPATSKTILLVANAPTTFDPGAGNPYSVVNKAIIITDMNLTESTNLNSPALNNFMMTNAKGGLEPSSSTGVTTSLTLYSSESGATSKPLVVNVDRVVSKVRVNITNTADDSNITITEAGWLLNATNKSYFPASVRTKTQNEINNSATTPYDQYKLGSYRVDPNYDGTAGSPQATEQYFYVSSDPGTWNAHANAAYCLENTQNKAHNKQAYTTHVLIRAKYTPNKYWLPDDTTEPTHTETTEDWMMINGRYYTATTLTQWIKAELMAKYLKSNGTPNTAGEAELISTTTTTALNTYLKSLSTVDEVTLPATVADEAAVDVIVSSFSTKLTDVADLDNVDKAKKVGSLSYFADAYSYYKVMIKHDNVDTESFVNELGEFGVVRNSFYEVNISKFNNPGYPNVPTPSESEDDEDKDKWVAVQININPWTYYSQTEEL